MAPNRRRGAGKGSSSATAARKQYKVGDLVLAKVKGFPAWPATVSEPEKWGYSTDWKKVLVYFFGTKQIGFCNPADVEAFTEEKKKLLLVKRQGKGADFVRAVDEIIESYEKSKKQNQDEFISSDEGTASNAGNSEACKGKYTVNSPMKSCIPVQPPEAETPQVSLDRSGSCNAFEIPVATTVANGLHSIVTMSEDPIKNTSVDDEIKETLVSSLTYLRKRSREAALPVQRRPVSVRRSRSASRAELSKCQKSVMQVTEVISGPDADVPNGISEESMRNKLITKSPSSSLSGGLVSNCSSEDVRSELVATESEAVSFNEGSTLESSCKIEHPDIVTDFLEDGVEMSEGPDLHPKVVVLKKKRKPNRKRVTQGIIMHAKIEKETGLDAGLGKDHLKFPDICQKSELEFHKADGDEHLPLVKRARARMGKPSIEEKKLDDCVNTNRETSAKEVSLNCSRASTISFGYNDRCPADMDSLEVKAVTVTNLSPSKTQNHDKETDPQLWKARKYHLGGGSLDGEAALPPSKRIHRALEAMSANVAEACNTYVDAPRTMKIVSNGFGSSTEVSSLCLAMDNKEDMHTSDNNTSINSTSGLSLRSSSLTAEEMVKSSPEAKPDKLLGENIRCLKQNHCKEISTEVENDTDVNNEFHSEGSCPSIMFDEKQGTIEPSKVLLEQFSTVMKKRNTECIEPNKGCSVDVVKWEGDCFQVDMPESGNGCLQPIFERPESASKAKAAVGGSAVLLSDADGLSVANVICEDMKITSQSNEENKAIKMYEVDEEVEDKLMPRHRDVSSDSTPMKVLIAAAQAKRHISRFASLREDMSDDGIVSDRSSSPHDAHGVDFFQKVQPSNSSNFRTSTLDNRSHHLPHNGDKSPVTDTDREGKCMSVLTQRQKPLGERIDHAEANSAWKSFGAMLGTLSRTKESIGRATRHAIDCAKYGIVNEVVELVLQNLECEPSLHRRVDLFFLVDSITQCSRGQKGGVGDLYPSAVQAVLPRLLAAAAPPGSAARENRRQCLKVLRVWLERKTISESVVRHHIRELDSFNNASFPSSFTRRQSKTERALNDPIREMEGMLVDEYGSNTGFQLSGLIMPHMLDEEENSSEEKSFEAVTPEHDDGVPGESCTATVTAKKHPHILEDVDGELEMEDVAPSCEDEVISGYSMGVDNVQSSHCQFEQRQSLPFAPPLPEEMPPSPPPLPSSPPPLAPPPPPSAVCHAFAAASVDTQCYQGLPNMENHLPHSMSQQPCTPSINLQSFDSGTCPPGYRDCSLQMLTSGSFSCASHGSSSVSNPSIPSGIDIQHLSNVTLSKKSHHLQPPPPTISNQFSYVQAEPHQRAQSWMDCSSSPFAKSSQVVHEMRREHFYRHHDTDGRCKFPVPVLSGPTHLNETEGSYTPVSYVGPLPDHVPSSNHGRSLPHRTLDYRHPGPPLRPPLERDRMNGATNLWRPR